MYIISLEYLGKTIDSAPISDANPSVDLMQLCHTQCQEMSNIKLSLNEHDEIMIQTTGRTPLVIERYSRKRQCTDNHPLMLFNHDVLWVGEDHQHRFEIKQIRRSEKSPSLVSRIARNTVMASAAALVMATVPACNQPKTQEPVNAPVVDQNAAQEDNDSPSAHPVELGTTPNPDAIDIPEPVGIPAPPEPIPSPEPREVGKPAYPPPAPHPEVIGEPPVPANVQQPKAQDADADVPLPPPELADTPSSEKDKDAADKDKVKGNPRPIGTPKAMGKCDCSKPCPPPGEPVPTCFGTKCCKS